MAEGIPLDGESLPVKQINSIIKSSTCMQQISTSANPQKEQPDDNRDEDAGISLIKVDIILLYAF